MNLAIKLPKNKQGIVIDILMVLANIFIFPFFSLRIERLFQDSFRNIDGSTAAVGILMLAVIACRLFGLYLKRYPLQARMRSVHADFAAGFLFLSIPTMILSAIGGWVVIEQYATGIGWIPFDHAGEPVETRGMTTAMLVAIVSIVVLETYLLFRMDTELTARESASAAKGSVIYGRVAELIADFGLFVYLFVWQVVYYGIAGWLLQASGPPQGMDFHLFRTFILAICFAVFYLSPRAVFLTEDRKYLSTWLFILAAFISSLLPHWLQQYTGILF